jgi:hypothetical protein
MRSLANLETEERKRRPRMHQHKSLAVDKKDTPGFWDIGGYGPTSFIKTGTMVSDLGLVR